MPRKAHHSYSTKTQMLNRLNRIEGQIRGIAKMIDEDIYCDEILHQFMSIESALKGVKNTLLEAHLKGCIVKQIRAGSDDVVDELLTTLAKMNK